MIQDLVEEQLMKHDYYSQAKAYILYRQKRMENRELMMKLVKDLQEEAILPVMQKIQKDFSAEVYDFKALRMKFLSFLKEDMSKDMRLRMLMKACVELISREAPKWGIYRISFFIMAAKTRCTCSYGKTRHIFFL